MSEKITCAEAKQGLTELQALEQELTNTLEFASSGAESPTQAREALKRATELRLQLEQGIHTLKEMLNPFEALFELKEQYKNQVRVLETAGILEEQVVRGEKHKGIRDIEGNFHALPSEQEVIDRMKEKRELLEQKKEQGFGKFLLVPFGMSLDSLIEKYKQVLLGSFVDMDDPANPGSRIPDPTKTKLWGYTWNTTSNQFDRTPIDLDISDPLYKWDGYDDADKNGKLVYDVKEFSETTHGGKTKAEMITQNTKQVWDILFVETNVNIPRQGKGQAPGGRKQIETNKTSREYLQMLQADPLYKGEAGLRPEEWLVLALTELIEKNEVIDDYDGNCSASFNVGAYFPASSYVPSSYFVRVYRQTYLRSYYPDFLNVHIGVRSGVRV